ncbi:hypothetical protein MMC16_004101 [Acarospora aff. strigata]|nr:hypothetical protein [Acarospora aff. strigata]
MSERRTTVDFSMPPPDNRHRSAGTLFSGIQNTPANSQAASLQGFAITPRPATTPASTLQTPDSLSQLLPPRRILPFDLPAVASNPKTATLGADTTTIQASHQAANVCEPIATKKTGTRTRKQQAKPKAKAPKAPKSKKGEGVVKSAVDDLDSQILHSQPERNLATPARVAVPAVQPLAHAAPLTAPSDNGPDEISPNGRKRSLMEVEDSQDTEDRLLSAVRRRSENNEHSRLQQAADNSRLPDANQNPSGLSSGLEQVSSEYLNRINSFVSKNMARPPPQAPLEASPEQDNSLKAYAAQSDEDRLAAIDTMICKNIMDDNFLKLCEDVERSWRRIGLGSSSAAESGVAKHIQQISKSADAALLENMCAD